MIHNYEGFFERSFQDAGPDEPDAKKPDSRCPSAFADYREKEIEGSIRSEGRFASALEEVALTIM